MSFEMLDGHRRMEIRLKALDAASRVHSGMSTYSDPALVLNSARHFEVYLRGDVVDPRDKNIFRKPDDEVRP